MRTHTLGTLVFLLPTVPWMAPEVIKQTGHGRRAQAARAAPADHLAARGVHFTSHVPQDIQQQEAEEGGSGEGIL